MGLFDFFKKKDQSETKQATNRPSSLNKNTEKTTTNGVENHTIVSVILHGETHTVNVPKGDTVLNAILDEGIDAPFMCEAGVCSSCRAKLEDGKAEMLTCHALGEDEINEGYILTCQAIPQTPTLTVNYDV